MHLYDHGIDIVQLFNPFQKVMTQMKKKVDKLLLQKVKPTQRGDGVFWQPTKWMARIIEGPSEPKANLSLTHLYHLQWNKLSHQHHYWNKGSCHCMLLQLHVDYDWSYGGDNPYYPF
jgi:hypothetical protein